MKRKKAQKFEPNPAWSEPKGQSKVAKRQRAHLGGDGKYEIYPQEAPPLKIQIVKPKKKKSK